MTFTKENAQNAYNFTEKLAFPRLVGTDGEKKAQELLENELQSINVPYYTENLKASAIPINILFRITLPLGAVFLMIAWLFSLSFIGLIFSLIGLLWFLSASTILKRGFGWLPNFGTQYSTKNFIAEISPSDPKAHLIYMAHYDSKSQLYPALLRVILFVGGIITGVLYSIRLAGFSISMLIGYLPTGFWNPTWISFVIMFIWNFSLIFNSVGNKSPGAIDNATSVAILIELIKLFNSDPPQNLKLSFIFTAAEELGLYGAADFINRHKHELDPKTTYFLNYDGIGSKKNLLLTSFGIPLKKTSLFLNKLIFEIAEEHSLEFGKIFLPIGAATDHVPIQAAGFEVACMVSTMPRTHTSKDTIDHVKLESLEVAGIIGFELAKKLDQKFKN